MRLLIAPVAGAILIATSSCGESRATEDDKAFCRELRVQARVARSSGGLTTGGVARLRLLADQVDDEQLADHSAELMAFGTLPSSRQNETTQERGREALIAAARDCKRLGAAVVDE